MKATRTSQQPVARAGTGLVTLGMPLSRIDAPAKVTGRARYAAEHPVAGLCHGVVVNSPVTRGRITGFQLAEALQVPGVIDILTHLSRPKIRSLDLFYKDMVAPGGSPYKPLHDGEIHFSGQPVALVVADTFEAARCAAALVGIDIQAGPHDTDLMTARHRAHLPRGIKAGFEPPPKDTGEPDAAFERAAVKIDAEFHHGVEHHHPMEMHATTVIRSADGHLTIHDKTQGSQNCRWMVSRVFGLSADRVTVKNRFVGGAFGSGLRPQHNLILAVMASLKLQRSVRVVLTRQQMFSFGHRPETWQHVKLGAESDGRLTTLHHTAVAETSRMEDYTEVVVNWASQLYQSPSFKLRYRLVDLDTPTPMDMRAPGAAHGMHALEVAMDELAYSLSMDPLALRLKNYAEQSPADGTPYSTKELRACYAQGAERFGWQQRSRETRARREGNEWVGWGMATGMWDAMQMFARADAVLHADGELVVRSAASDIGTGTYTVMSQIAAAAMGLPMERVVFELGDSTLPLAPIEGGSSHVTTVGSAVAGACEKLQRELLALARSIKGSPLKDARWDDVEFVAGKLQRRGAPHTAIELGAVLDAVGKAQLAVSHTMLPNLLKQRQYVRAVHSAVFCEVRVDEDFGTVRVTRVVSAVAAGRIISERTARSQVVGGVVWGISQALHEESYTDHNIGRFMNHNLSEYHVPVNADIGDIDVLFVDEDDRIVSRLGAKGVGEIGLVSVSAAISNAVFHATGRRVRSTPMTPDKVMSPAV